MFRDLRVGYLPRPYCRTIPPISDGKGVMPGRGPLCAVENAEWKIGKSNQTAGRCACCFLEIAEQISALERDIEPDLGRFIDLGGIIPDVFLLASSLTPICTLPSSPVTALVTAFCQMRIATSLNVACFVAQRTERWLRRLRATGGRPVESFGAIPEHVCTLHRPIIGKAEVQTKRVEHDAESNSASAHFRCSSSRSP